MKILARVVLVLTIITIAAATAFCYWLYAYSGDIPNFAALNRYSPNVPSAVASDCSSGMLNAIPYDLLGNYVQRSVSAAEGDDRAMSLQISRRLFCNYERQKVPRQILELKASVQIRRRFTPQQVVAIYLNGAYFGEGSFGIDAASRHYYGKSPSELSLPQAAMLLGLLKSPSAYSPSRHPERARVRRDEVLAKMIRIGAITPEQGQAAMQTVLE